MSLPADSRKKIHIIATLGPSTKTEADLRIMKEKGVDFVRLNMSHSTIPQLRDAIMLARKVGIPFIVDTEGSQVRTGILAVSPVHFTVGDIVRVHAKPLRGDRGNINLTPDYAVQKLVPGDILYCDFDSLALCVSDITQREAEGYVVARVISGGSLGNNKGVFVHTASGNSIDIPTLTPKDHESIALGLELGVGHVAASFMRSGEAVEEVRRVSRGRMQVISKVECIDGLTNLDGIIDASDMLLVDRGDLSKEIFLHRIPFSQKIIVHRARKKGKPVIVATNFLESMITKRTPTRAEIHDIESSITDGAAGLTLAAETAIGEYPFECISTMQNVIGHVTSAVDVDAYADKEEKLVEYLESRNYLLDLTSDSMLVPPNGGVLINRFRPELLRRPGLASLPWVTLDAEQEMDVEQIGVGSYSPLTGFMTKHELQSVLDTLRLPSGTIWPLPIVLAVHADTAHRLHEGSDVVLKDPAGDPIAILHLSEKYTFDKREYAQKLYGTLDEKHPGVRMALNLPDVFLGGAIELLRRRTGVGEYELTPAQTRRLYESLGWSRVVGFHTRNVIHRSHEFIQRAAMERVSADGLFVHPIIGKKKKGDFNQPYIIKSYEIMMRQFYPPNHVVMGALATYSRYAGPREALFTALVRQNFGCSHFIVGRDHTGVGNFYPPKASHEIFDRFPDLKIVPVRFDQVFFSTRLKEHVHEPDGDVMHNEREKLHISGTQARVMFEQGELPPEWFMRPEISGMIAGAIQNGEDVFVK